MSIATVELWGTTVGYVAMDKQERFARFEYDPEFVKRKVELAPLMMPIDPGATASHANNELAASSSIYQFPQLPTHAFHGLPGLIADSLPDKFGQQLINVWLAQTGRKADDFNAVDRLCYTGERGMGALEFKPAVAMEQAQDRRLELQELIQLASMAFASKKTMDAKLSDSSDANALLDILSVGTSAGGARAKAVIAFNPDNHQVRSGQLNLPAGFEHWLIKFDGVEFSGDWGIADPSGYGLLEYSYYLMAKLCDIDMMESRLLSEHGRNHFMTRRFDRDNEGGKRFVQTFGAIAHFDYYQSGAYSYEQLFMTMKQLGITKTSIEQQFRRVVFNLVSCNQDDHVKNFAFMMDRSGRWDITPAYDLCHSEGSDFTRNHQLSINGKLNDFDLSDLKHLAQYAGLPRNREKRILEQTVEAFSTWSTHAEKIGIPKHLSDHVLRTLRLNW